MVLRIRYCGQKNSVLEVTRLVKPELVESLSSYLGKLFPSPQNCCRFFDCKDVINTGQYNPDSSGPSPEKENKLSV
jgi:hypothetical protein